MCTHKHKHIISLKIYFLAMPLFDLSKRNLVFGLFGFCLFVCFTFKCVFNLLK